jgi:S1-C subfamily serine protease
MRKIVVAMLVALMLTATGFTAEKASNADDTTQTQTLERIPWKANLPAKKDVAQYLQDISVTVNVGYGEGSGVIKTRLNEEGKKINFVWTAAHVVDSVRNVETVIDPRTGTRRIVVKFDDVQVIKELVEGGRKVGELRMDAEVIRYSEDQDLALLKIRKTNFVDASVVFYLDKEIPAIGTDLFHVGSLLGQVGSNSMTSGIISQIGRVLPSVGKEEFDQTTATSFPGSSGGGVYLRNGAYVGMIVRGAGEGFNLMVPVRRMQRWAESADILWALDDSVPVPSDEELAKLPIEDSGHEFERAAGKKPAEAEPAEFHTLIRKLKQPRATTLFKLFK